MGLGQEGEGPGLWVVGHIPHWASAGEGVGQMILGSASWLGPLSRRKDGS